MNFTGNGQSRVHSAHFVKYPQTRSIYMQPSQLTEQFLKLNFLLALNFWNSSTEQLFSSCMAAASARRSEIRF